MNTKKIQNLLNTRFLGKNVFFEKSVDSTQLWAKKTLVTSPKTSIGSVFLTDFQTHGMGRNQRTWESKPGQNILLSFIDSLPADPSKTYQLALVAGVALLKTLEIILSPLLTELEIELKWPNDIFYDGKKLAGILCEATPQAVIIGIGININEEKEGFSESIKNQATSLKEIAGITFEREKVIAILLGEYETARKIYDEEGIKPILNQWVAHDFLNGKKITFTEKGIKQEGVASGLNENGFLKIRVGNNETILVAGDILCY